MKILGIDQSLNSSGIVILEGDHVLFHKAIKTNKKDSTELRIKKIRDEIRDIIKKFDVDIVSIEGLPFGYNHSATRRLAGLFYSIVIMLLELNVNYKEFKPTTIKKFAGNARAKKIEIVNLLPKEVREMFLESGYKKSTGLYDLSDAYFVAKIAQDF